MAGQENISVKFFTAVDPYTGDAVQRNAATGQEISRTPGSASTIKKFGEESIYERLERTLNAHGMREEAEAVLTNVMKRTADTMEGRWSERASGLSLQSMNNLLLITTQETIKWMDANNPNHWAREMFAAGEPNKQKGPVNPAP